MSTPSASGWGLRRLGVAACWQAGWTGVGVRVGHLDTGVDAAHPALVGRVAAFAAWDAAGQRCPAGAAHDSGRHGTHTAGLICGGSVDGQAIGVAPAAHICAGQVIEGGHVLARVLAGLDWLLDSDVRVVCLALGVPGYHPLFEMVIERLRRAGVLVVCPIGNGGRGSSCSPANYSGVLAVGAIDQSDRIARFSGGGLPLSNPAAHKPDLVAPGVGLVSAEPGGRLAAHNGTSLAAALVAGVAALLYGACPAAAPDAVAAALLATAEPLPHIAAPRQGRGLVRPLAAIEHLLHGGG